MPANQPIESYDDWKMPFGKHKGESLKDIPVRYLDWVIGNNNLYEDTRKKITAHLENSRKSEWEALS